MRTIGRHGPTRVATRSFALAKAIDEVTKDTREVSTEAKPDELREGLISTGREASRRYVELARSERTIHVVDASMYGVVSLFLGLSLMSIHRVADVGPVWEVALLLTGLALCALGLLMLGAVIRRLYKNWRAKGEALPQGDQVAEVQLSHADES